MAKIIITWLSLLLISFTSNVEDLLMANIVPISRGRALTETEVNYYFNQIGDISDNDLWTLASTLYGMDYDTFLVWLGWEAGEGYEYTSLQNPNPIYLGYMSCNAATNLYVAYSDHTAAGLCATIRGADMRPYYDMANMQGRARTVLNNWQSSPTYQYTMRVCYLSLANPDQRVWSFALGNYGDQYKILHCYNTSNQDVWAWLDPFGATRTYSYDVDNGGVLGGGYDVYSDTGYPTKLSQFRAKIFHALAIPTMYWSKYPHNLGYWNRQGEADPLEGYYANQDCFSFDCNNLVNAILNGWYDNRTYGYFQQLTRTGDQAPDTLINRCDNVSYDFTQLSLTSVLFYDGPQYDHIGVFVGEFVRDGHTYNTIECTTAYGGGVVSTYVDRAGRKYANKESGYASGSWLKHGLLTPWLVYDVGNIDPGGNISPVNPGGGGVNPPWVESPQPYGSFTTKPWMYQKRYDLQPKNRWRYI